MSVHVETVVVVAALHGSPERQEGDVAPHHSPDGHMKEDPALHYFPERPDDVPRRMALRNSGRKSCVFRQLAKVLELQHLINSAYNAGAGRRRVQSAQSAAPSPQISAGESSWPSMSTATEYKEVRPASLLQPVVADLEAELPQ
ncbi:uncharacterized protein LOC142803201 [Rhipicephalus microplus]|uniref:uncharacterized protein LOC142803201 n=1 Tax=Rhipicephalus microplus TaxID=6941 RepID=UPI003F6B7FDD